jgi:hypothetical protein
MPGAGVAERGSSVTGPRWLPWAAPTALAWLLGYGSLQLWWTRGHRPSFGALGTDLMVVTGPAMVAVCGAAAIVAAVLVRAPRCRPAELAGWLMSAVLVVACPLLLLDVVGRVLPGLGIPFDAMALVSRAACLVSAVLLAAAAVAHRRRAEAECLWCGRRGDPHGPIASPVPGWATVAAAVSAVCCLVRIGAQVAMGFDGEGAGTSTSVVFIVGFLLAGLALPLALVPPWGRRLPRFVLLVPAAALALGLLVYFGVGLGQLTVETIEGTAHREPSPLVFLWVSLSAYWLWGLGLGAAALSYARRTRKPCRHCGR